MSLELDVLRALLRLARRRSAPSLDQLVVRVGGDEPAVRVALLALAKADLVQRTPAGLRLSMAGLAVAVAYAQRPIASGARAQRSTAPSPAVAPPTAAAKTSRRRRAA